MGLEAGGKKLLCAALVLLQICHDNFSSTPTKYETCMDNTCLSQGRALDVQAAHEAGLDYDKDVHLPLLLAGK